ncbi:MAG: hypothetical protein WB402_09660 [Sulfuricaulis sp.]|uniref:hypothetical protein n=1 Tax=Sulfuricaulis sp. TaxID=2003553 RepID=UPI003C37B5B6
MRKSFSLSQVYGWLPLDPVVLVTTAQKGGANIWIDPARKHPRTLHHLGKGRFVVDGRTITLPSRMK